MDHEGNMSLFVQGSIELEHLLFGSDKEKVNKIRFGEVQVVHCIWPIVCESSVCEKLPIVSSKATLVDREDTCYETKMSPFAISK